MNEEKARNDAEALASALGITFYVVRGVDGRFSAVQLPLAESEIVATIRPSGEQRSLDEVAGFAQMTPRD